MAEHLEAYTFAVRAADVFGFDFVVDSLYLVEVQLASEDHYVGNSGIKAHGLDICDVALCGNVNFHIVPAAGVEYSQVGGNDCRYSCFFGCGNDAVEVFEVGVVYYSVDGEVCFYLGIVASTYNLGQVVECEVGARARPHVEAFDSEVYGIRPGFDSRRQRLVAPHRSHYLKIFPFHRGKVTKFSYFCA